MNSSKNSLKTGIINGGFIMNKNQKGQGLIEYLLIVAVVVVAVAAFATAYTTGTTTATGTMNTAITASAN